MTPLELSCVDVKKNFFLSVIYRFSYRARVFVRLCWKSLQGIKHYNLLRKFVNYGQKSFITLGLE